MQHRLRIRHCQLDVNELIEYCFTDQKGHPVTQAPFHREWQEMLQPGGGNILIMAARSHAKCLVGDTLVTLASGERVPVADISLGKSFDTLSWTEETGYCTKKARVWQSTKQQCYEIKTLSGRDIRVSTEHPFWTARGWVPASELTLKDTLSVARGQPHGTVDYGEDLAWLLGLIIGDGSLSQPSRVNLTIAHPEVLAKARSVCERVGYTFHHKQGIEYAIYGRYTQEIRRLKLNGTSSHTKHIPDDCFTWDEASVRGLISGYFAADGTVCKAAHTTSIASVSKKLLQGVQSLLLRFSVVAHLRKKVGKYKGLPHISWNLVIAGGSTHAFYELLDPESEKSKRVAGLLGFGRNASLDLIPDAVLTRLDVGRGTRSDEKNKCRMSMRRPRGTVRPKVLRFCDAHSEYPLLRTNAELLWDPIVSIEPIGVQQTYSVEVDSTHVHVTNDFVTHNTTQVGGKVLFSLGNNHNLRIKIVGSTDIKAEEILGFIRENIESNTRLHEVFPDLQLDKKRGDTKSSFFVKREIFDRNPTVQSSGVLTSGAGGRADILVCDDVVDPANAISSPAYRIQVINAVKLTWFSLVSDNGCIWWLCTPYHIEDASYYCINTGSFTVRYDPAIEYRLIFDENEKPVIDPETGKQKVETHILWPEVWSFEKLEAKRLLIGETEFAQQYLLETIAKEDLTFPESVLMRCYNMEASRMGEGVDEQWPTFAGVDLAASLGVRAASTVILTLARDPENDRLHVKDIYRGKIKFPQTIQIIQELYERHRWAYGFVENNAYQDAVLAQLDDKYKSIPLEGFTTGKQKSDINIGLPGMASAMNKGLFAFPAKDCLPFAPTDMSEYAIFWRELCGHPGVKGSDTVMALWFAYSAAIRCMGETDKIYTDCLAVAM